MCNARVNLADDYVVITHNFLPSVKRGLGAVAVGAVLLLLSLSSIVRRQRRA